LAPALKDRFVVKRFGRNRDDLNGDLPEDHDEHGAVVEQVLLGAIVQKPAGLVSMLRILKT
jgi:hypothetical protein